MENLSELKSLLRKRVKNQQENWVKHPERNSWDRQIRNNILTLIPKATGLGAAFVSLADEPKIWPELANDSVWQWTLPKMTGSDLEFLRADSGSDLKTGNFGVQEPVDYQGATVSLVDVDLVCVPGLAFDQSGARLGRGKGFYDRVLGRCRGLKIGVCYSSQFLSESVPTEAHDVRMNFVVTEKLIHKVKA